MLACSFRAQAAHQREKAGKERWKNGTSGRANPNRKRRRWCFWCSGIRIRWRDWTSWRRDNWAIPAKSHDRCRRGIPRLEKRETCGTRRDTFRLMPLRVGSEGTHILCCSRRRSSVNQHLIMVLPDELNDVHAESEASPKARTYAGQRWIGGVQEFRWRKDLKQPSRP